MALNINGRMKVKTLRADFLEEFGLTLRVYNGRSFADNDATLASIRKDDSKGGEFAPRKNTKVGNLEDKILELFGIKTQVAGSDDSYLCDNDLTLAGALEDDEKKMTKKVKKTENQMETNDDAVIAETESTEETTELTDEEKRWLDDLWSLDEAPEAICASKAFMLEAAKENGNSLKYASDEIKSDSEFALEIIKSLNDKDPESYKDFAGLEYFSPSVFDDEAVIDEMISVTAFEFIARLLRNKGDDNTLLEVLKQHNNKISSAVKKEFDQDFNKAKDRANNDNYYDILDTKNSFTKYTRYNLSVYSSKFEIEKNPDVEEEYPLWDILVRQAKDEIISPLEDHANSFSNYLVLTNLVFVEYKFYDHSLFTDPALVSKYLEQSLEYLDEADIYELAESMLWEEYWNLEVERPDIYEKFAEKLGELLLEKDIQSAVEEMYGRESVIGSLSSEVKSELLQRIESLSDDEKEEIYNLDEFIEGLEE